MILGYYAGYLETSLDQSFRYVAWGSQYSGGSIQFDPIFGCISHFFRRCQEKGINLKSPFERHVERANWADLLPNYGPYLFVLAGETGELTLEQILAYVELGSNLVILSSEYVRLRAQEHRESAKVEEFYDTLFRLINAGPGVFERQSTIPVGKGTIFFFDANEISDAQLEPGPFEQWSLEKSLKGIYKLDEAIRRVATFNVPCVDCEILNIPSSWPRGESFIIEVALYNRSSRSIPLVRAAIVTDSKLEPLSLIDFEIADMNPIVYSTDNLAMTEQGGQTLQIPVLQSSPPITVNAVFVPRNTGEIKQPFKIQLDFDNVARNVPLSEKTIRVVDSLPKLVRSMHPPQIDIASTLPKFEAYFESVATASTLLEMMAVDPASVVQKARQIGEYIARQIATSKLPNYSARWEFALTTQELHKGKIISDKSKGYIDTVRYIGNLASHPTGNAFNREDATLICQSLILFLSEVKDRGLI